MNLVGKISCITTAAIVLIAGRAVASETSKKEARVTQVIREVKLLPSESSARPAVINEKVSEDTAVRTGDASRSELTFADLTLTRLGENTIFSFNHGGRNARLDSGSILLRVPKNSGGGGIRTRAVTVGITGTTVIFESTRAGRSKLTVLEGGARLALVKHPKESAYVRAGQMLDVPAGATTLPAPVNIDLDRVMKTSPLITDFPAAAEPGSHRGGHSGSTKLRSRQAAGLSGSGRGRPGNRISRRPAAFLSGRNGGWWETETSSRRWQTTWSWRWDHGWPAQWT